MLDISMINPYIRVAMDSILPANHEIKRRIIFDYELIYIADGEFVFYYDDIAYPCKAGQFIFIRPGIPHSFSEIKSNLTQPHIHFDISHLSNSKQVPISFKDFSALTENEKNWIREDIFFKYPKTPFVYFSDNQQALQLFYEIVHKTHRSALLGKAKLLQLIEMLLYDNFANIFKQDYHLYPVEKQVKDYIDAGQGLTVKLDDFAKHFNYSKCYLDHCFHKKYGIGIIAYRNQKRMQAAKELLKHSSVTEVSENLGFSSIYAFSRAFKYHFGISPTASKTAE